jgi:hypothetical protein
LKVSNSNHFSVEEFALPPLGQKLRNGFAPAPYPTDWIEGRLRPLCQALEVLREALGGRPIRIVSGYRPKAYNRAIGGARFSQHVEGRAADIVVDGMEAAAVHDLALRLAKEGRMRIGGLGSYASFTHIDVRGVPPAGPSPRLVRWAGGRSNN